MKLGLILSVLVGSQAALAVENLTNYSPMSSVSKEDDVSVTGVLQLSAPGTYSAKSWTILGNVLIASPGTYTLMATHGSVSIVGTVQGPISGTATLVISAPVPYSITGVVSLDHLVIVDGSKLPPPPPIPPAPPAPTTPTVPPTPTLPPAPSVPPVPPVPTTVIVERAILTNMSVRATLASGQTISPGFVIAGSSPRTVLLRAIGPSLSLFSVQNPLPTPTLTVYSGANPIASNSGWGGSAALVSTFSSVGAFPLIATSRDAAVVVTLSPGNYTVAVGGGNGEVLLEVYFVE